MRSPLRAPPLAEAVTPEAVAAATREAMWKGDRAAHSMGMVVEAIGPGSATLAMTVREDMLNGHDLCHGGLIATLADGAFAYACNAYNEVTVASGFDVSLIASARLGDRLTARAVEQAKTGRTGLYDVEVTNQRGECIALLRGRSITLQGKPLVEGLPMGKQR